MDETSRLILDLSTRGVALEARGGRIRYRPRLAVDADLRRRMLANKPALLRLITTDVDDLDEDARFEWRERAAIMEHDGDLSQDCADALALHSILAKDAQSCGQTDQPASGRQTHGGTQRDGK